MTTRQKIRFGIDTWAKGDRGLLAAHATDRPGLLNMRVYADGSLGPRPRWQVPWEVPAKYGSGAGFRLVPGFFTNGFVNANGYLLVDNLDADFHDLDGDIYANGSFGGSNHSMAERHSFKRLTETLYLVGPYLVDLYDGTYSASPASTVFTVTDLPATARTTFGAGSSGPYNGCHHGGRVYLWGGIYNGTVLEYRNRVFYTNSSVTGGPTAYNTFSSASQYFDVEGVVAGCISVGPNLFIWTEDGEWTMMQGVGNPGDATFTSLGRAKIPGRNTIPAVIDRAAVFLSSDLNSLVTITSGGTLDDVSLAYLGLQATAYPYSETAPPLLAVSSLYNSSLVPWPVVTSKASHNHNNVWTQEDWDLTTYGRWQVTVDEYNAEELLTIYDSGAANWMVHKRPIAVDEPETSVAGDFSEYAEDPEGTVILPRVFDPTRQVRVFNVVLDVRVYSTTGDFYPLPTMQVEVDDGDGNNTVLTLGPGANPLTRRTGSMRVVATGELPPTSFSDISITGIKGVVIENVTVEFEVSEGRIL